MAFIDQADLFLVILLLMSIEVDFNEKNMDVFVPKHNSSCSGPGRDIESSELDAKVASL